MNKFLKRLQSAPKKDLIIGILCVVAVVVLTIYFFTLF